VLRPISLDQLAADVAALPDSSTFTETVIGGVWITGLLTGQPDRADLSGTGNDARLQRAVLFGLATLQLVGNIKDVAAVFLTDVLTWLAGLQRVVPAAGKVAGCCRARAVTRNAAG
jgi:hypothetical protein